MSSSKAEINQISLSSVRFFLLSQVPLLPLGRRKYSGKDSAKRPLCSFSETSKRLSFFVILAIKFFRYYVGKAKPNAHTTEPEHLFAYIRSPTLSSHGRC